MIKQRECQECGKAFEPDYPDQTLCFECICFDPPGVTCPYCGDTFKDMEAFQAHRHSGSDKCPF